MGLYINPPDLSKEEWLAKHAVHGTMSPIPPKDHKQDNAYAVCLVDNGAFTAAGVAYSQAELEAWKDPKDFRPKFWFFVPEAKLRDVCGAKNFDNCVKGR